MEFVNPHWCDVELVKLRIFKEGSPRDQVVRLLSGECFGNSYLCRCNERATKILTGIKGYRLRSRGRL